MGIIKTILEAAYHTTITSFIQTAPIDGQGNRGTQSVSDSDLFFDLAPTVHITLVPCVMRSVGHFIYKSRRVPELFY